MASPAAARHNTDDTLTFLTSSLANYYAVSSLFLTLTLPSALPKYAFDAMPMNNPVSTTPAHIRTNGDPELESELTQLT